MLVSDLYAAYNHYPGLKQRCWVRLLRDIDELTALYPDDTGLARWAGAVQQLYVRAKACVAADGRLASRRQLALEKQLLTLCRPCILVWCVTITSLRWIGVRQTDVSLVVAGREKARVAALPRG